MFTLCDCGFFFLMIRRPPRSTLDRSSAASDVYKRQVNHRARQFGRTKYGISRTIRVVLDLVTVKFLLSYSTRPLQIFGLFGSIMGIAGGVLLAFLGYMRLTRGWSADGPILLLGVLLGFTGVPFCLLYTSPSPRDRTRSRMPSSA